MAEAAPEKVAARERFDIRQDRRAGRCKAGDHLKKCIDVARDLAA